MTARAGMCSKQGDYVRVCALMENVFKSGNFGKYSTEYENKKCLKAPKSVENETNDDPHRLGSVQNYVRCVCW